MIRNAFLSLGLLGLFFLNTTLAAAPQNDIQCKVEQDQVNTAFVFQGMLAQSYRSCSKGTIAYLEVIADVEFDGGSVDVAIMDQHNTPRALKTFTADNYNGTSLYLGDLAIPTLKGDHFLIMIKTFNGASCILPGTDDAEQFVGDLRVAGDVVSKNLKFQAGIRGAEANLDAANQGRGEGLNTTPNSHAHARNAAGLDLDVEGDCVSAQRSSTGVLSFEGETFVQVFPACDRGQVTQIKLATPYVEPGNTFEFALMFMNGNVIDAGQFTSEDVTDGELLLTLDQGAVRKGNKLQLKVTAPEGARITTLAKGVASNNNFGRLYVNGQSVPFNIAMAAGLKAATAEDVQATHEGREDIEIGAYPVPFGETLSITVRGILTQGAFLQLLDHQGMPIQTVSFPGGKVDAPIRFGNLNSLRPGLYTVRLVSGDAVVAKRILKG